MRTYISAILILAHVTFAYAQEDTARSSAGRFWSVHAGFNLLIPTRSYKEELIPVAFHEPSGEFNVSPKTTADNFFLNVNYDLPIYRWKRSRIGLAFGIGWLHQRRKSIKEGWYGGDGFTYLQGTMTSALTEGFLTLTLRPGFSNKVSKKAVVYGAIDVSVYSLLYKRLKWEKEGESDPRVSGGGSFWTEGLTYLNTKVETGVSIKLTNRLTFNSSVNISLLYANLDKEYFRPTPTSVTPYPASITEFNYISINNSLVMVIGKLKR